LNTLSFEGLGWCGNNKTKLNTLSFEGQKKQKPIFSLRQLAHTHHTQKPKALGLRFTKGKTMPLPKRSRPSFAFCFTAAEGKSITPKIQYI
jgi:hypothetical protein